MVVVDLSCTVVVVPAVVVGRCLGSKFMLAQTSRYRVRVPVAINCVLRKGKACRQFSEILVDFFF